MAVITKADALRPVPAHSPCQDSFSNADSLGLDDFEAELKRLAAANDDLLADLHNEEANHATNQNDDELVELRRENAELRVRLQELEAAQPAASENDWLERQQEYEMLLEEKSEVIRSLHQKIQELQENADPRDHGGNSANVGQAEEILRLKRELEDQRRQLEQDEADMMEQMSKMEMTMAKERAEMARQKQEIARLQADLAHEIEQNSRDSGLKERLQNLRRAPGGSKPMLPEPPQVRPEPALEPQQHGQNSSSFFRRIFG